MDVENDTPVPKDEEINWPKGRLIKRLLPKFGTNKPPWMMRGRLIPNGRKIYDNDQN